MAKDGGWRLGELQHACPFSAATADFLDACRAYRDQSALSPEEKVSAEDFHSPLKKKKNFFFFSTSHCIFVHSFKQFEKESTDVFGNLIPEMEKTSKEKCVNPAFYHSARSKFEAQEW